jgi:hypothetical protein
MGKNKNAVANITCQLTCPALARDEKVSESEFVLGLRKRREIPAEVVEKVSHSHDPREDSSFIRHGQDL